ncbi:MAG: hypothetical protein M5R36_16690 [Deltaproteobacteria bacterium]|nr:hypothetical protein [Deltaproteobacteria bacterium]
MKSSKFNGNPKVRAAALLAAALVFALAFSGCSELEEAIDELTTQNVDFYQGIYDGYAVRPPVSLKIAQAMPVSANGPVESGFSPAWTVAEQVLALDAGLDEVELSLDATVENTGNSAGRVYVFFAPSATPTESQALLIGSIWMEPGQLAELTGSEGFEQSAADVEDAIVEYFLENQTEENFHVFLYGENAGHNTIVMHELRINATPTFSWLNMVPASLLGGAGSHVDDIGAVGVTGTFRNKGTAPARFVWVVNSGDGFANVEENLIIDTVVDPGRSTSASDGLVVPEGLKRLESLLKKAGQRRVDLRNPHGHVRRNGRRRHPGFQGRIRSADEPVNGS